MWASLHFIYVDKKLFQSPYMIQKNKLLNILCYAAGDIDPADNPTVANGKLCDQDFEELRASCLDAGELFTDPEFPPDDQSLFFSKEPPFAFEWKRASEISDDPRLFEGGASRFDINQVLIFAAV